MNKIITIGREFGSGGRELGKRLSEQLGYAYYDKEIISEIAKRTQMAENYVQQIVERKPGVIFPITVRNTFHIADTDYMFKQYAAIYAEQANVVREMAERSDCVIVGRCADYILRNEFPLRLFIYADMESRIARCRAKGEDDEAKIADKDLRQMIVNVDKNRAKYYRYYTGQDWGDRNNYDLCINTTNMEIKQLAESLADLIKSM